MISFEQAGLWGLFFSAFISSTIAPGGSEILLAYLANQAVHSPFNLLMVATVGNTLGALTTYGLGRLLEKRYPLEKYQRYQRSFYYVRKYGVASLLFSWLPIIGDGFCFAAGWLKTPVVLTTLLITIGKAARYSAILYFIN